jgi:ribosomal protein S18 acetylase RimI-like enzyme
MITIRKATISDLEAILALNKKLFEYEAGITEEFNQEWTYSEAGKAFFKERLENENAFALIAQEDNKIAGYMLVFIRNTAFRKRNPLAEIEHIFIEEEMREKGVGTMLMEETKKILRDKKVPRLKVQSLSSNINAVNFYKDMGFNEFLSILETDL